MLDYSGNVVNFRVERVEEGGLDELRLSHPQRTDEDEKDGICEVEDNQDDKWHNWRHSMKEPNDTSNGYLLIVSNEVIVELFG